MTTRSTQQNNVANAAGPPADNELLYYRGGLYKGRPIIRTPDAGTGRSARDDEVDRDVAPSNALYRALYRREWDECRSLLARDADDAARMVRYTNASFTTLHYACGRKAPLDVVEAIHRARPELVANRNVEGRTPLHYLFYFGRRGSSSPEEDEVVRDVLDFLLRTDPRTAAIANKNGDLPLHDAVRVFRRTSWSTSRLVDRLLVAHPNAVRTRNHLGSTPLHVFLKAWERRVLRREHDDDDERTFSSLSGAFVDARRNDDDERRPSHEVVRCSAFVPIPLVLVRILLRRRASNRVERTRPNREGDLLLHVACALSPSTLDYNAVRWYS